MPKPTSRSITEQPCTCGFLERQANNPASPIVFDTMHNEYHIEHSSSCGGECSPGKGYLLIYHCPFCGGAAPESKRPTLFTSFTPEEQGRLFGLFEGMQTLQEVIAALGSPDEEKKRGLTIQKPEKDGQAPTMQRFRLLRYTRLSDTADVEVYVDPNQEDVQVMLMGKYIGPPIE